MALPESLLSNQIGVSVIVVYAIQLLKDARWFPWLAENTDKVTTTVSVVVAFLSSLGFQFEVTGNWQAGGVFTATLPPLSVVVSVFLHAASQFGAQQLVYHGFVKPKSITPCVTPAQVQGDVISVQQPLDSSAVRDAVNRALGEFQSSK